MKKAMKVNSIFWQPVNCKTSFWTNCIYYWQIRFCSYYAFSINQMSDIYEVWKYQSLKDGFRSISQRNYRAVKLLPDISFGSGFQKTVLLDLLLFSCACYQVDLDYIQWNEVATSATRNFNNSWLLYFHFSRMINLCPNIWFTKNPKCQRFLFWRKSCQRNTNCSFF